MTDALPHPELICWGELLWDIYPTGKELGGSSANVAINLHRLGATAWLISRVGADDLGDTALRVLSSLGLPTHLVQRDVSAPTGSVHVTVRDGEPRFRIDAESAWDKLEALPLHFELVQRVSAIVFGTLAQRTLVVKDALRSLLASRPKSCRAICDLNLRPPYCEAGAIHSVLQLADVVKLNESELRYVSNLFGASDPVAHLFNEYPIQLLAVTRGPRGCVLVTRSERVEHAGLPLLRNDGDAVGAGDAFTAALARELLLGSPLEIVAERANDQARRVASARGGFGFVA